MLKLCEVKWFCTDNDEIIPYVYDPYKTKIKELLSGSIIDLPEDLLQIHSLACHVAITNIYGKNTKFYSSHELLNEYLHPIKSTIILNNKFYNQLEVDLKQIELMKRFIEQQIKKEKNQEEK